MANGSTPPTSIQATTSIGLGTTGGLVIAEWLVAPSWPPPVPVLTIAVGLMAPVAHLIGRAIYRKIAAWAGPDDDDVAAPAVPAAPPPIAPAIPVLAPIPAAPAAAPQPPIPVQ